MTIPAIELRSERLLIRPAAEEHLEDLMAVNGDPEVTQFLPYESWRSLEDAQAWLARMNALGTGGTGRQFVVVLGQSGHAVGTVLLFKLDSGSRRAELGYVLGRAHWGNGLMKEALSAVLAHSFEALGLRRIEAEVNPVNKASSRLLLKLGFQHEGCARKRWVAKGRAYDTDLYGLLAEEWPQAGT